MNFYVNNSYVCDARLIYIGFKNPPADSVGGFLI